jgi:hypothetical protein
MFNYAGLTTGFNSYKVIAGMGHSDGDSHITLFAGKYINILTTLRP